MNAHSISPTISYFKHHTNTYHREVIHGVYVCNSRFPSHRKLMIAAQAAANSHKNALRLRASTQWARAKHCSRASCALEFDKRSEQGSLLYLCDRKHLPAGANSHKKALRCRTPPGAKGLSFARARFKMFSQVVKNWQVACWIFLSN